MPLPTPLDWGYERQNCHGPEGSADGRRGFGRRRARVGVRTGDFILALNGQAVQYVGDLHRGFAESPFGEPVRLGLLRRTRRMVLEVTPEETQRREN